MKKLFQSTIGKFVVLAAALFGGYEVNEHFHLIGQESHSAPTLFSSSPPAAAGNQSAEFQVKNCYVSPTGRILLGSTEDYLDPQCQTVVVPSSIARLRSIDAGCVGRTVKATGYRATYKGRPQLVAASIEVK